MTIAMYTYSQSVANSDGRECPYTVTLEVQADGAPIWEEYGVSERFTENFVWFSSYTQEVSLVVFSPEDGKGTYNVKETAVSTTSTVEAGTTSNQFQLNIITIPLWMEIVPVATLGGAFTIIVAVSLLTNPYPQIQKDLEEAANAEVEEAYDFGFEIDDLTDSEEELGDWSIGDWGQFL